MKQRIKVFIGEAAIEAGELSYEVQGNRTLCSFAYSPVWLRRPDSFNLSPDLQLVEGHQFHKGESAFFRCFADTEPDGWGREVIQRVIRKEREAHREKRGLLGDLDYLLGVSDRSRMGALRLQGEDGKFQWPDDARRGAPPIVDLDKLLDATRNVENNRETLEDLAYLRGSGTSLDGMRPKASIIDTDGTLAIGKFPSVKDRHSVVHAEVLAMTLAAQAGLNVARTRVEKVPKRGGRRTAAPTAATVTPVAIITRFDRENGGRVMYLSAHSLLLADKSSAITYEDIAATIRQYSNQAPVDLRELWCRITYNLLINNIDDHLKNQGFLHRGSGHWNLAPAFDINPFPDKARDLKTAITADLGGYASFDQLLDLYETFGFAARGDAGKVLARMMAAVSGWKTLAASLGMSDRDIGEIEPAFQHPEL